MAVVVSDPEQLTQGTDTETAPEPYQVEQSPCRSIFPPWPWPSVIRDTFTQGNDTKTTMEQMVEQSPCRRSSPENRDYSPMDAGLDLQEHDGKAQPWQRDGFSDSR